MSGLRYTYGKGGGVVFVTDRQARHTLSPLTRLPSHTPIAVIDFARLCAAPWFSAAVVILCDVERRSRDNEEALGKAAARWCSLENAPLILNQPPAPMRRYALLRSLYLSGVNRSNIYRLDDPAVVDSIRYPCFIRDEGGHHLYGGPPPLLNTADELMAAIKKLQEDGYNLYGRVACEYEDIRTAEGYVKMSYFRVGDQYMPAHRFVGDEWFLKHPSRERLERDQSIIDAEQNFLEGYPYRDDIVSVFDMAGIEYGRIDFAPHPDGGIQVFEINTNPNHPGIDEVHPLRREFVVGVQKKLILALNLLAEGRKPAKLSWPRKELWRRMKQRFTLK